MGLLGQHMALHGCTGGLEEHIREFCGFPCVKAGKAFEHGGEGNCFVAGGM